LVDATTNQVIARSIGLGGTQADEADRMEDMEEGDLVDSDRVFHCEINAGESFGESDDRVFVHPMIRGVFIQANEFDNASKHVLVIGLPGIGIGATIGVPQKINDNTLEVDITRENQGDFIRQLNPTVEDAKHSELKESVDAKIKQVYGAHFDYNVLNNAFVAMSPAAETWVAQVRVRLPYILGDLKDVIQYNSKGAADALVLIPLRTNLPPSQERAQVVDLFNA
jgi:hypothetical protein